MLVVCASEFGRTAITLGKDIASAGRDHHPHGFSVWLAGGWVKGGHSSIFLTGSPTHRHTN